MCPAQFQEYAFKLDTWRRATASFDIGTQMTVSSGTQVVSMASKSKMIVYYSIALDILEGEHSMK